MKRNILLLIAWVLGLCYAFYLISHFGSAVSSSSSDAEMLGAGLATALVAPHMFCVIVAVVFNIIAWICNARWAALVAGIMYAVSMVCFFLYALFVLIQMILCFVAYSKMKNS